MKVITYHIDAGNGEMIVTKENLKVAIEQMMPMEEDLGSDYEIEEDGTITEVTITIKKCMTQEEVDALPEFDF